MNVLLPFLIGSPTNDQRLMIKDAAESYTENNSVRRLYWNTILCGELYRNDSSSIMNISKAFTGDTPPIP